jgi:predicted transcriptional regulator
MAKKYLPELSRRERQLMDAVYRLGRPSAAEVLEDLPDPPSNAAVRAMLGILVRKGRLKIVEEGPRYHYLPTKPTAQAGRTAIQRVVEVFFKNSLEATVAALLDSSSAKLTPAEVERLKALIEKSS